MSWMFAGACVVAFVLYLVNREGRRYIDKHPLVKRGVTVASETLALLLVGATFGFINTGQDALWAYLVTGLVWLVLLAYAVFLVIRLAVLVERDRLRDRLPKYRRADPKYKEPAA